MAEVCEGVEVWPVKTNAAFLANLLRMPEFRCADLDTGLIARRGDQLTESKPGDAVNLAAVSWRLEGFAAAQFSGDFPISPAGLFGFRLNAPHAAARFAMSVDGEPKIALVAGTRAGDWDVSIDGRSEFDDVERLPTTHGPEAKQEPDGTILIFEKGTAHEVSFAPERGTGHAHAHDGDILSPMPGKIIAVEVVQGQAVTKGQKLLTLEAMKMEHTLTAPFDGVVAELSAVAGAQVQVEALLARIEAGDTPGENA